MLDIKNTLRKSLNFSLLQILIVLTVACSQEGNNPVSSEKRTVDTAPAPLASQDVSNLDTKIPQSKPTTPQEWEECRAKVEADYPVQENGAAVYDAEVIAQCGELIEDTQDNNTQVSSETPIEVNMEVRPDPVYGLPTTFVMVLSKVDLINIKQILINRGNCHIMNWKGSPELKFGQYVTVAISKAGNGKIPGCTSANIKEVKVETDTGEYIFSF